MLLANATFAQCWYDLQWQFVLGETATVIRSMIVVVLRVDGTERWIVGGVVGKAVRNVVHIVLLLGCISYVGLDDPIFGKGEVFKLG